MARFYIQAASDGNRFDLSSGKSRILIGRHPDCDIVLTEGHPSRKHASLTAREDGVWLEDLGSANGTFVNEARIENGVLLQAGDRVRFDTVVFQIGSDAPELSETVTTPADMDATVLRPAAQQEVPVPAESSSETPGQSVPAADSVPEPVKETVAPQQEGSKPPASWADPEYQSGEGTMLVGAEGLQALQEQLHEPIAVATEGPCLTVLSGASSGKTFKLAGNGTTNQWEIGSDGQRDIVLDDEGVSAFHAKLVNEGKRWKLINQMSANGTWVNQKKSNISYLQNGDRVRFAMVDCQISLPGNAAEKTSRGVPTTRGRGFSWVIGTVGFLVTLGIIYAVMQWLG